MHGARCGTLLVARLAPGRSTVLLSRALGTILIANELYYFAQQWVVGTFALPLYLCDVAAFVCGLALWWPRPRLVELAYFWAIAGSLQGLLTPDVTHAFPTYLYFQYYIDHVGVVAAGIFLVVGQRIHPQRGAVPRVYIATVIFTMIAGLWDVIDGTNYMYLRQIPSSGSLLNDMGPPWHDGCGVALVFLLILDAPFWHERRVARLQARPPSSHWASDVRS